MRRSSNARLPAHDFQTSYCRTASSPIELDVHFLRLLSKTWLLVAFVCGHDIAVDEHRYTALGDTVSRTCQERNRNTSDTGWLIRVITGGSAAEWALPL